jgi:hypothetical protein
MKVESFVGYYIVDGDKFAKTQWLDILKIVRSMDLMNSSYMGYSLSAPTSEEEKLLFKLDTVYMNNNMMCFFNDEVISFREFLSNNCNFTSERLYYVMSIWNDGNMALLNIKNDDEFKRKYANLVLKRLKPSK